MIRTRTDRFATLIARQAATPAPMLAYAHRVYPRLFLADYDEALQETFEHVLRIDTVRRGWAARIAEEGDDAADDWLRATLFRILRGKLRDLDRRAPRRRERTMSSLPDHVIEPPTPPGPPANQPDTRLWSREVRVRASTLIRRVTTHAWLRAALWAHVRTGGGLSHRELGDRYGTALTSASARSTVCRAIKKLHAALRADDVLRELAA